MDPIPFVYPPQYPNLEAYNAFVGMLIESEDGILAQRFLTVAGLVILLYDTILTTREESHLIWSRPFTRTKLIFLLLRYTVIGSLILVVYALSGFAHPETSDKFCKIWLVGTAILAEITLCLADFILIMRVYALWDHRPRVLKLMLAGWALSYGLSTAFGIVSLMAMMKTVVFEPVVLHMCLIQTKPPLWIGVWAAQVAFDVFLVIIAFLNEAHRPRDVSVKLIADFYRDGGFFFAVLFSFRLLNLILNSFNNVSYMVLGFFCSWAMLIVIMCRLVLRLENMKMPPHKRLGWAKERFEDFELYVVGQGTNTSQVN